MPSTRSPCVASATPIGRIDAGEPVKPWIMRTPVSPDPSENGSAPGRIAVSVIVTARGVTASVRATTPAGVDEQLADEEEERQADRAGQADQQEHEEPLEEAPSRGQHVGM